MFDPDELPVAAPDIDADTARPSFYIPLASPTVTRVILVILLAAFAIEIVYGFVQYGSLLGFAGADTRMLVDLGAKVDDLITAGETWRLFTATLLHGGILHLLFNLYALYALGPMLEAYMGHTKFAVIYLLSGLYGSLASYAFTNSVSVGASGAIFGVVGGLTVYFARYRDNFGARGRAVLQNMIFLIVVNLIIGLSVAYIDNWGHIGGLIGGALVTAGLLPRYRLPETVQPGPQQLVIADNRSTDVLWVLVSALLFAAGVFVVKSGLVTLP